MKKNRYLIIALISLSACFGDVEKYLSTDQQVEGTEIIRISQSLDESLIFALQSFEYFKTVVPDTLPGCPDIEVNDAEKTVTLMFSNKSTCTNNTNMPRSGRILLQYINRSTFESSVVLIYDDYVVKGNAIEGLREFRRFTNLVNPNRRTEIFENLVIRNDKQSSSKVSGTFVHQLTFQNSALVQFTSEGNIEGRNIAGRKITMSQGTVKTFEISCILSGHIMPKQGSENWQITHGTGQAFNHGLDFSSDGSCISSANIRLQDGRVMVVTQ